MVCKPLTRRVEGDSASFQMYPRGRLTLIKETQTRKAKVPDDPLPMRLFLDQLCELPFPDSSTPLLIAKIHGIAGFYMSHVVKLRCEKWIDDLVTHRWQSEEFLTGLEESCDETVIFAEVLANKFYSACAVNLAELLKKKKFLDLVFTTPKLRRIFFTTITDAFHWNPDVCLIALEGVCNGSLCLDQTFEDKFYSTCKLCFIELSRKDIFLKLVFTIPKLRQILTEKITEAHYWSLDLFLVSLEAVCNRSLCLDQKSEDKFYSTCKTRIKELSREARFRDLVIVTPKLVEILVTTVIELVTWDLELFLLALEGVRKVSVSTSQTIYDEFCRVFKQHLEELSKEKKFRELVHGSRRFTDLIMDEFIESKLKEGERQLFCYSCANIITVQGRLDKCPSCKEIKFREITGFRKAPPGPALPPQAREARSRASRY